MGGLHSFLNQFNFVKQIPIFAKLNWFELQRIARKSFVVEYKKGDIILNQGDPPDYFYCLISGRLQAYTVNNLGEKDNVDFIHRGMHFGIISVLTGETHSMTFETLNDSVVLQIKKEDFEEILNSIPLLAIDLSQSLSKRIRKRVKGGKSVFESTIISIYSPVKGTGSSTYAINLALSLEHETKKNVILVSIRAKQAPPKTGLPAGEAAPRFESQAIELKDIIEDHEKIYANIKTGDLKIDILNVVFDAGETLFKKQISPLVSSLVGEYHYVLVDLPNEMDDFVMETLTQSDAVHLITYDRRKDLNLIRNVIDQLEVIFKQKFRSDKIYVIVRGVHDQIYLSYEEINKVIDFDVYTMLPQILPEEITEEVHSSQGVRIHRCDERSRYAKEVRKVAREIGGVMVGLVLGGGAALGVAHIGVIRVLEEENIPVDIVVGSSMGALISAIWVTGKTSRELEMVAREFEKGMQMIRLFDPPLFPISGLVRGGAIRRWLKKHLGNKTFYSSTIPLKIVAYDLKRREELIINTGSLVDAVRQSIAIPGVIKPVTNQEQMIIDGGVLNPLPTNVLASLGIKKIIAVNVLQSPEQVSYGFDLQKEKLKEKEEKSFLTNPISYITHRIFKALKKPFNPNISDIIVQTLQATEYVIAEQSAQQADIVIHPDLSGIKWFELYRVDDLIKRGEEATRKSLEQIKNLVSE